MGIYLGSTRLDGSGGGTLPTHILRSGHVDSRFQPNVSNTVQITANNVPSGYTFLCWIGVHDPTYKAVFGFNSPTSQTTNVNCASVGGNSSLRTFSFYYLCVLSELA